MGFNFCLREGVGVCLPPLNSKNPSTYPPQKLFQEGRISSSAKSFCKKKSGLHSSDLVPHNFAQEWGAFPDRGHAFRAEGVNGLARIGRLRFRAWRRCENPTKKRVVALPLWWGAPDLHATITAAMRVALKRWLRPSANVQQALEMDVRVSRLQVTVVPASCSTAQHQHAILRFFGGLFLKG